MATRAALQVGIRVGAVDDASGVIQGIVNRANSSMSGLMGGLAATGIAHQGLNLVGETIDQFESKESALARVRIMTMKVGHANDEVYGREKKWIEELSSTYTGSIEDYAKMTATLLRYRITPEDVMGGVGEAAAKLGVVFDVPAEKAAAFFGKMKNDFKIPISEMNATANLLSKVHRMGVGLDGADAINEMTQAFSKEGLAVQNLGMNGAKAAEDLGILSAMFITKGLTGQSTGNNLRRLLDNATDPKKQAKIREAAAKYGKDINFFKNGQFGGIDQFVAQLTKLKGLNPAQIHEVLDPFSGRQGLSIDMVKFLAKFGEVDFAEFKKFKNELISIDDEFAQLKLTQKYTTDVRKTNIENLKAAIGGSMTKDMKRFNDFVAKAATYMKNLTDEHPAVATMTTEFGSAALAVSGLYGGLRLVGGYIPVLGTMAQGLAASFAWVGSLAAAALILKGFVETASPMGEKQRTDNPNSVKSKLISGYDEIIKDPETGFIRRNLARLVKSGIVWNTDLFGDHSEGSKYNSADENKQIKFERDNPWYRTYRGNASYKDNYGGSNNTQNSSNGITYAPQIVLSADTIDKQSIDTIFKAHSQTLYDTLLREVKRQNNMSYGKPK